MEVKGSDVTLPAELGQEGDSPFTIGLLLRQAHERVTTAIDAALKPLGVERRHLLVLMRLNAEGPLPQRDLVRRTHHDKASIVRIVDDLERLGLASRESVPGDRRLWAVTITDEGRRLYQDARDTAVPAADLALAPLTSTQIDQLQHLLGTLIRGQLPDASTDALPDGLRKR